MDVKINRPPRSFRPGRSAAEITDCGHIRLGPDEQVTFTTEAGAEYDVVRKAWGFYATPSVNGPLVDQGFKTALVKNSFGKYYVLVVDPDRMADFEAYLETERHEIVEWLDQRQ